jgi:hypothetical protein
VALHLTWASAALIGDHGITAPTALLATFVKSPRVEGVIYLFSALLAIAGCRVGIHQRLGMMLCVPQMLLLWISGESSLLAVVQGQYPDGTVRPALFILRDQAPCIMGELFYSCALFPLPRRHQARRALRKAVRAADILLSTT